MAAATVMAGDVISCSIRGTRAKTDYGSNNSSGALRRAYGAGSWEVTLNMLSRGGTPEFVRGETGMLTIAFANTDGTIITMTDYLQSGAAGAMVTNAARVSQDLSNATVEYEYRFVSNGSDLTWTGAGGTKVFMKTVLFGWD